jgi:hypothetical protein
MQLFALMQLCHRLQKAASAPKVGAVVHIWSDGLGSVAPAVEKDPQYLF